jgi:hypothetical protein
MEQHMHNPDVSHDVSQSPTTAALSRPAQIACGKSCGLRLTSVSLRWTTLSKPWTTRCPEASHEPIKPGKSMILGARHCTLGVSRGVRGFVHHVCKHHLHHAPHTMKGGECGDNTHENQRRPERAVHITQHRVSPHRVRALRARLRGISDAHRRRLRTGLHHTPSLNTSNLVVGR